MARFKPGQSGNPKGRPAGRPDKRTKLRGFLEPHAQELIEKAVELAKNGDTTAPRLCLERLIPPMKATDSPVKLDGVGGTLSDQGAAIISAMGTGKITPDQAAKLLQTIAAQARVVEVDELEKRVSALEATK